MQDVWQRELCHGIPGRKVHNNCLTEKSYFFGLNFFFVQQCNIQPSIFDTCSCLGSGSQGFAGDSPSCHRSKAGKLPVYYKRELLLGVFTHLTCMLLAFGRKRTRREPTLTQEGHATLRQKGSRPRIKPSSFYL